MANIIDRILGPKLDLTPEYVAELDAAAVVPSPITAASSSAAAAAGVGADITGIASPGEWSSREHMARITLAELFNGYADQIPVNRETALGVAAIDRGHQLITGQISAFPLVHLTGGVRTPVQPLLIRQPEAGRSRSQTIKWWLDSQLFHGRAWCQVTERYADTDLPRRVKLLLEENVELDTAGRVLRVFGAKPTRADDVKRLDGPHDGILNRPKRIREAIAIDVAAANASANPVPSIDLHQKGGADLTDDQIDKLIARWVAARSKNGTGGVGFSNPNVEVRTLGIQPEQLLINGRNQTALNIARMLNLPAWAVDASVEGSSLTYSNVPSRARELVDYTYLPYMTALAERLSMDDFLPAGQTVRFDTNRATAPDLKETADVLKVLVDAQIITTDQARSVLAGTPLEAVL